MKGKKLLTVQEAGRIGGQKTASQQGPEFYKTISKAGGKKVAETLGREHYQRIGRKGGAKMAEYAAIAKRALAGDLPPSAADEVEPSKGQPITTVESGQLGGVRTAKKYGREHYQAMGKASAAKMALSRGPDYYRELGRKGGKKKYENAAKAMKGLEENDE